MSLQEENTKTIDPDSGAPSAASEIRDRSLAFAEGGIPILQDIVTAPEPEEIDLDDLLPAPPPEQDPGARLEDIERVVRAVSAIATDRIIRKLEPRIRKEVERAVRSALQEFGVMPPVTGEETE
jgi:hypothetical protein